MWPLIMNYAYRSTAAKDRPEVVKFEENSLPVVVLVLSTTTFYASPLSRVCSFDNWRDELLFPPTGSCSVLVFRMRCPSRDTPCAGGYGNTISNVVVVCSLPRCERTVDTIITLHKTTV
jgi:hypothetical protein